MIVLDGDRHAQLFAGVLVQDGVVALRHRELAQRLEVDAVLRVVGAAAAGRRRRADPAAHRGRSSRGDSCGRCARCARAHGCRRTYRPRPRTCRRRSPRPHARRRPPPSSRRCGPARRSRLRGPACRQVLCAQNMLAPPVPVRPDITRPSISLLSKPVLSSSDFEDFAHQHPDVPVAFLHHLGFGVGHDGVVTQGSSFTPFNYLNVPRLVSRGCLIRPASRAARSCRGTGAAAGSIPGCGCIRPPCARSRGRRRSTCPAGAAGCW